MHPKIDKINKDQMKDEVADFNVGDTVKVHTRIVEGGKERIQIFTGTVIAKNSGSSNESFTVRRVAYNVGVERVFPVHSPRIAKIEVDTQGDVSRAKLYYLRDRVGKGARIKSKIMGKKAAAK